MDRHILDGACTFLCIIMVEILPFLDLGGESSSACQQQSGDEKINGDDLRHGLASSTLLGDSLRHNRQVDISRYYDSLSRTSDDVIADNIAELWALARSLRQRRALLVITSSTEHCL